MIGRNKIQAVHESVTLQYANGKSLARPVGGNGRFTPYVGFHIEVGRDTTVDDVLAGSRVEQIEIKHQRQGGMEIVRHWGLGEEVRIFPVTSGPVAPTVAGSLGRNTAATAEAGLGMRWGANERSKMAIRGYLEILAKAGCLRLVQLSVRSRMTDVLLGALLDHGRVCEAADSLIDRNKHPEVVTFHEIALPLGPSGEEEWGKGDTTTVVPFRSLHPATIDAEYLRSAWRPDAVHAAAQRDWANIQLWAQEYATQSEDQPRQLIEQAANGHDDVL
ncbi:MAG TPA: hypothetical protein PKA05_17600 [Roseiflexaceae bacterium]|nr:hypothetical protein [Roseiflexaceae bacterium]HMP42197.1 hypothetical protein [Roseiflexaceae bacterium]